MAARGLSFRALVVLGMNERVFPRFSLEDPFLRDAVRSRLEHRLGCRMSRAARRHDEERLLFELLRGSADRIVLSHQRSDERGRLQIASAFLPAGEARPVPRRPAERLKDVPFDLLTPREASLRTGQGEALGRAIGWDVTTLLNALAFLDAIEARGPLTKYDGLVDAREYWNSVASFGFSPSALEKLAECPFRYFAARMMDLAELPEPEEEAAVSSMEIGTIYHDVLERFHRRGDLDRQLEDAFRRFEATRSIRYPVLWEVEKDRIRRVLRAFVAADDVSFYAPQAFEVELKGELPVVVGGRRAVAFRGFADRLDAGPGGAFRVVDYKKSRSSRYRGRLETAVFDKGRLLQAPIYFLLAALKLGRVDLARSKFVYYFLEEALEEGGTVAAELDGPAWARRADFDARLSELLERIPRGEFPIRPGEACGTCEFPAACRKAHRPTRWRAEEADMIK
jgi:ATP-dependent helicase/nuclease subunit B